MSRRHRQAAQRRIEDRQRLKRVKAEQEAQKRERELRKAFRRDIDADLPLYMGRVQ